MKRLRADIRRGHANIYADGQYVCSAFAGRLQATPPDPTFENVRLALPEQKIPDIEITALIKIVKQISQNAYLKAFGCSIIIDTTSTPLLIAGNSFTRPFSLDNREAISMFLVTQRSLFVP